jgi:hypothetical protein
MGFWTNLLGGRDTIVEGYSVDGKYFAIKVDFAPELTEKALIEEFAQDLTNVRMIRIVGPRKGHPDFSGEWHYFSQKERPMTVEDEATFDPAYCIRIVGLAQSLRQWDIVADGALALIEWVLDSPRNPGESHNDKALEERIAEREEQTMSFARQALQLAIGNLSAQAAIDANPEMPLGADVQQNVTETAKAQSFAKTDAKIRATLLKIRATLWEGQVGRPRWLAWAKLRTVFPG